jgi:lipid II:glycine glycyltransferase (peptidoglycan interpeptide bridge formation enzyme)
MPSMEIKHTPPFDGHPLTLNVSEQLEDPEWDTFLQNTPGGHPSQSSMWGRVKTSIGWRTARLIVKIENQIVGGAQIEIHPLPVFGAVGYVPAGPLVPGEDRLVGTMLMEELKHFARRNRIQYLIVQPPRRCGPCLEDVTTSGFRPTSLEITPAATILVDLRKDIDDIRAHLRKKVRHNIKIALHAGLTVREGTEDDLDTFYRLLIETSKRQGFPPEPLAEFKEMWRTFHPGRNIRISFADYQGVPISTLMVVAFGDTVFTKRCGWSGEHGNLKPNELLTWETITWAKDRGYQCLDFEGIDLHEARAVLYNDPLPYPLEKSTSQFKLGWAGEVTLCPTAHDYLYNPLFRFSYDTVFPKVRNSLIVQKLWRGLRGR